MEISEVLTVGFTKSPFHPPLQPSFPTSWDISIPQRIAQCRYLASEPHLEPTPALIKLLPQSGKQQGSNCGKNHFFPFVWFFNTPLELVPRLTYFTTHYVHIPEQKLQWLVSLVGGTSVLPSDFVSLSGLSDSSSILYKCSDYVLSYITGYIMHLFYRKCWKYRNHVTWNAACLVFSESTYLVKIIVYCWWLNEALMLSVSSTDCCK